MVVAGMSIFSNHTAHVIAQRGDLPAQERYWINRYSKFNRSFTGTNLVEDYVGDRHVVNQADWKFVVPKVQVHQQEVITLGSAKLSAGEYFLYMNVHYSASEPLWLCSRVSAEIVSEQGGRRNLQVT